MVLIPGLSFEVRMLHPYLVFAVCLAAGLDGIQKKIYPTKASDRSLSESDQKEQGIENLPENLREAITLFEDSSWMKEILGETFCKQYAQAKRGCVIPRRFPTGRSRSICIGSDERGIIGRKRVAAYEHEYRDCITENRRCKKDPHSP